MRRNNFENESQESLCNPYQVALTAAKALNATANGQVERV